MCYLGGYGKRAKGRKRGQTPSRAPTDGSSSPPLVEAKGRGGLGAPLALNYNSQVWRSDAAGHWSFGKDLGYGFGWRMLSGDVNYTLPLTMPRGGTTQTRTFAYNTLGQLVTTVNPEDGTTTLAYNTDGSLFSKTAQKA